MCQIENINEIGCEDPFILKLNQCWITILRKLKIPLFIRKVKKKYSLMFFNLYKLKEIFSRKEESKKRICCSSHSINAGDVIRIRSKDLILQTLDKNNKLEGCVFMPEMWQYCETQKKVIKIVEHFFDECQFKMRKTRNIVLLEGLHCSGKIPGIKYKCDRFCYFFWKEAWLEKIE